MAFLNQLKEATKESREKIHPPFVQKVVKVDSLLEMGEFR